MICKLFQSFLANFPTQMAPHTYKSHVFPHPVVFDQSGAVQWVHLKEVYFSAVRWLITVQCSAVQCSAVQCSAVKYSAVLVST